MSVNLTLLMESAAQLQRALTLSELVHAVWDAVTRNTRYRHTWLGLFEQDDHFVRFIDVQGSLAHAVFEGFPLIPVDGDAMVLELKTARAPVIVHDAPTDPRTNKDIVSVLKNRTIVNIPLVLGGALLGTLGVGTYGDEGPMVPTADELEFLVVLAMQVAGAFTRLQLLERQRQDAETRLNLERHLESLQRVELMGVLAAGVAHDLNNLLTVVSSGVDLLSRHPDAEVAEDARVATDRAIAVVRQLLQLGKKSAARTRVNLRERVDATCRLVRSSIPRGVALEQALAAVTVEADPVQVDQVVANLLINARDAVGPQGTITVRLDEADLRSDFVSTHPWARVGQFGRIAVRDSGVGMTPEVREHIFDPLFTTKTRGTGLGLAVVSQVVQQHHGLLHCDSAPGVGSTFEVYFPTAH